MPEAISIKDLKPGDAFTGTLDVPQFTVDGDTVTMAVVIMKGEEDNLETLATKKTTLESDIAYRQSILATVDARIALLTPEK